VLAVVARRAAVIPVAGVADGAVPVAAGPAADPAGPVPRLDGAAAGARAAGRVGALALGLPLAAAAGQLPVEQIELRVRVVPVRVNRERILDRGISGLVQAG
jgi:hypothetical protein